MTFIYNKAAEVAQHFGKLVPRLIKTVSPDNYRKPFAKPGILQLLGTEWQNYVFNCACRKENVHLK